jgi:hypothetical protein
VRGFEKVHSEGPHTLTVSGHYEGQKSLGRRPVGRTPLDAKILLKWVLKTWYEEMWTAFCCCPRGFF